MKKLLLFTMMFMSLGVYSQDIRAKRSQTQRVQGRKVLEDKRRPTVKNSSSKTSYVYKDEKGNTYQVYREKGTKNYFIMVKHPRHGWQKRRIKF